MFKNKIIKFLVNLNIYHIYIEYKHIIRYAFIRIIGELQIFFYIFFGIKPNKVSLVIDRRSFGEAIDEYINVLSNLNKFIVDKSLKKLHVYIIGNVTNKLIEDWFNQNMNSLTEEFIIEKKFVNSNSLKIILKNKNILFISYLDKYPLFLKSNLYIYIRLGNIGSFTNRFDLSLNYKNLLKNKKFVALENFSKKYLSKESNLKLREILKRKVVIFYDYDTDNRANRLNLSNKENTLEKELFLRNIDNSIIIDSLKELINRDFNIVRLGRSQNKFPLKNKKFYDFAFEYNSHKDMPAFDFLLPFYSELCITLGSGAQQCAKLFGIPTLYVGYHRFDNWQIHSNAMFVPKKFYFSKNNSLIPLSKLQRIEILPYSKLYWDSKNIYIKSPSKYEIKKSLLEFLDLIKNNTNFSDLNLLKINSWQEFYLKNNSQYQKAQISDYKQKQKFSVFVSQYELNKYKNLYFK